MAEEITIDGSGRVVIPKGVRNRLRLHAGSRLLLVEEDDRLVLVPRETESSTVERGGLLIFRGVLGGEIPDHRQLRDERLDRFIPR